MNILKELAKKINEKVMVKSVLGEETYCFIWNDPATAEDIFAMMYYYLICKKKRVAL